MLELANNSNIDGVRFWRSNDKVAGEYFLGQSIDLERVLEFYSFKGRNGCIIMVILAKITQVAEDCCMLIIFDHSSNIQNSNSLLAILEN